MAWTAISMMTDAAAVSGVDGDRVTRQPDPHAARRRAAGDWEPPVPAPAERRNGLPAARPYRWRRRRSEAAADAARDAEVTALLAAARERARRRVPEWEPWMREQAKNTWRRRRWRVSRDET